MPYRRNYKKRRNYRKRRGNKRGGYGTNTNKTMVTSLTNRGVTGVPDRFSTSLKYVETLNMDTAASGVPTSRVYRGNGLFDPDAAVGGHQPYMWDQLSALYQHYTCWGSKIIVQCRISNPFGMGGAASPVVVITPTNTSISAPVLETAMERPRARSVLLPGNGDTRIISNSVKSAAMLTKWRQDMQALTTADPVDQWFWHVITEGVDNSESNIDCTVTIFYDITFYERKVFSQS